MKRVRVLLILCFVLFSCSYNKKSDLLETKMPSNPFNSVCEKEIREFISYARDNEDWDPDDKLLFELSFFKKRDKCYMQLASNYFYKKNLVKGYVYVDTNLIILNKPLDECVFIDEKKLMPFKDSITGYKEIASGGMYYDGDIRIWRIESPDSLITIYTGSYFSDEIEKILEK